YPMSALVYDRATGLPILSSGQAERPIGVVALRHRSSTPLDDASAIHAAPIGPASLVGRALPDDETPAGETVSITLYWRATEPVTSRPATVRIVASDGRVIGQVTNDERRGAAAPWPTGVLARDVIDIPLDPTAPAGDARVEVGPRDGPYTPIGEISVSARPRSATIPPGFTAVAIPAADFATLAGWATERRGDQLVVRLAWRSTARTDQNWTVFVHLVTPDGRLIANQDGPPASGAAPTRSWLPGEIVVDEKAVTPPSDGPVLIRVGFYDNVSGRRATIDGRDAIDLGPIGG
ncbi:MAG: hypothetical protein NZ518_06450, partial [Dehalococcoidia bacterium]|nr:hypothetical protein [Dehalococcoidia bacterium]